MARQQKKGPPAKDRRPAKKKTSILTTENIDWIDYKDVNLLRRFMSERAKIRARRVTGNSQQQQVAVAKAIRVAREMALLPYSVRQVTQRSKGRPRPRSGRPRRSRDADAAHRCRRTGGRVGRCRRTRRCRRRVRACRRRCGRRRRMKIVLRADVDNFGKKGDLVDVADGYARNYLVPRGLRAQGVARNPEAGRRDAAQPGGARRARPGSRAGARRAVRGPHDRNQGPGRWRGPPVRFGHDRSTSPRRS